MTTDKPRAPKRRLRPTTAEGDQLRQNNEVLQRQVENWKGHAYTLGAFAGVVGLIGGYTLGRLL